MKAHRVFVTGALLLALAGCANKASERFPELEVVGGVPAGFTWAFLNGPDFYTYVASNPAQPECTVGVYFGTAPQFHPSATAHGEVGAFAGRSVMWEASSKPSTVFRREALLPYRHNRASRELTLHIWAQAPSQGLLNELVGALGSAQVKERPAKGPA